MNTYKLQNGETIEYPDPPRPVADFLARVRIAANDPTVSLDALISLIYGPENPLLDHTMLPGRAMVTKDAFANPVFHVMQDQIGIKREQLGLYDPVAARAAHTLSVPDVAKELGISPSAVRQAIAAHRLGAMYDNGQYWIHPNSVASYKVSTRGPKRAGTPRRAGPAVVWVAAGGKKGASLSIRVEGGELVPLAKTAGTVEGYLPTGWKRAVVRTTSKTGSRAFVIEPAARAQEKIEHNGLYVIGAFKVVRKANSTKAAQTLWRAAGDGATTAKATD
jgi:hypothetical protein